MSIVCSFPNVRFLLNAAEEVWGIDSDAELIKRARAANHSIRFCASTAEQFLGSTSMTFDLVVSSRLLGFIPDLHELFSPLRRATDGWLLLSDWHPMACWVSPDGFVSMDYSVEGSFAPGQYHHSLASITNALIECGFKLKRLVEGPARRFDSDYKGAPATVQGLPLTITWVCTTAG